MNITTCLDLVILTSKLYASKFVLQPLSIEQLDMEGYAYREKKKIVLFNANIDHQVSRCVYSILSN